MFILSLARFLTSLLSIVILVAAGYLLWTWYQGAWVHDPGGDLVLWREDWRIWTGAALAAWSVLGGRIAPMLLAKPGPKLHPAKTGALVPGASGSSLYVERSGSGDAPTLLFTHGWGMDSSFWAYIRKALGGRYRTVVWDLPGLGRSEAPEGGRIALSGFASDLAGLIGSVDGPVVLVGHSIGGMTIQTLIRDHPTALDRVAGVILLNTTYTNPLRTMVFSKLLGAIQKPILEPAMHLQVWLKPLVWLSKWHGYLSGSTHAALRLGFGRFVTTGQLDHAALLATRASPAIEAKGDLAMFHWDATDVLRGRRTPALVVGGDLDIVTKLEASQSIAAASSAAVLKVVEGVNHMGPMEQAERYAEAISAFVASLQAPTRQADNLSTAAPVEALQGTDDLISS